MNIIGKIILLCAFTIIMGVKFSYAQGTYGVQIGATYYDLQTNSSVGNRIVRNSDGTMAVVWTQSLTNVAQPTGSDRGFGYNYWNDTSWTYGTSGECGTPHGCASEYTGWPEIINLFNGYEIVVSHTPLKFTDRATKGTGAWNATASIPIASYPYGGDTWPKAVGDSIFIHIIASSSSGIANGVDNPVIYHRGYYSGGSVIWDIQNYVLPGMDSTVFNALGADSYSIDAKDGTVAIVAGGFGEPWVLWKSTSNGDSGTWVQTIISPLDVSNPVWTGNGAGKVWTYDNAHSVAIDHNGIVHASVGEMVIVIDSLTGEYDQAYYPGQDSSLYYWNETMMNPMKVAWLVDYDGDNDPFSGMGLWPSYKLGHCSMSRVSVDQDNNPYIVYSGTVEGTQFTADSGQSYRDLYVVWSPDGGITWSKPINAACDLAGICGAFPASGTDFEEDVYPSTPNRIGSDNKIHVVWQLDGEPGTEIQDGDPTTLNYIMYYPIDITTLPFDTGAINNEVLSVADASNALLEKILIYPNPASDILNIGPQGIKLKNIKLINMTGGIVYEKTCDVNFDKIDVSLFESGIYILQIDTEKGKLYEIISITNY